MINFSNTLLYYMYSNEAKARNGTIDENFVMY